MSTTTRLGMISFAVAALGAGSLFAATLPSGFKEFPITGTITNGTRIEFSPDGKLYVLEKAGTLEVYQGSGATNWTQVAPSNNFFTGNLLTVSTTGERGLLGLAFDPNYGSGKGSNRYLYVYYTATAPAIHNRISRFTANANGTQVVAGSEATLMDLENLNSSNHNGGAIHFGPDGKLYVSVGENVVPANAQSISNRLGKILRLNPNPANPIPSDNPTSIAGIAGSPTGLNKAIWAAGLRNPFTFAFKPGTSLMYINDVGQDTWEEVSVGAAGANFGWSQTEGSFNQASFPNFTQPIISYQHTGGTNNYPPGLTYTGQVIIGGAFYLPPNITFPPDYIGDYFFVDYLSNWIKRYDPANITVQDFAANAASPVDIRAGSDGALYYLARAYAGAGSGSVVRIQRCPGDVTMNGITNVDDLLAVINSWGPCAVPCPADLIFNGNVNVDDLLAVINGWGPCS